MFTLLFGLLCFAGGFVVRPIIREEVFSIYAKIKKTIKNKIV